MPAHVTVHGYLEVRPGPDTVPGSVELLLPESVTRGGVRVVLSSAQAWQVVARLIVALEGTAHLSEEQVAALAGLFR